MPVFLASGRTRPHSSRLASDGPSGVNLPLAMVIGGVLALPVALVARRTVEDYFIVCTMGMGYILFSLMNNCMALTSGPLGIAGIPPVALFGFQLTSKWHWTLFSFARCAVVFCMCYHIKWSPLGRLLVAISEDEILCQSFGKNVALAKLQSFVLGAMIVCIPGSVYAHYVSFISTASNFTINESIFLLSIVLVGGLGNLIGSLVAATFMIVFPELLRSLYIPSEIASHLREALFGMALILAVYYNAQDSIVPMSQEDTNKIS